MIVDELKKLIESDPICTQKQRDVINVVIKLLEGDSAEADVLEHLADNELYWMSGDSKEEKAARSGALALRALPKVMAEAERLRDALEAIVNHEPKQFEVCCDEFAYDRLVKIYRDAARAALNEGAKNE